MGDQSSSEPPYLLSSRLLLNTWHQIVERYNMEEFNISWRCCAKIGGCLLMGESMFNRLYGDPNISKLLQLVVNIP